jgi:5-hydroxyisourate hydrolase-like protein (transthyretin family)
MQRLQAFVFQALAIAAAFVCVTGSAFAQTSYRVAGIVLNDADGSPLGKTRVSLAEVQDRRKAESIITGADGRFEFRNVPAGKFSLEGAKRNFLVTTYQWHEGLSTAIVTGVGLDTEHLILRLIPFGSIAGKVIDEAGEPIRNARVKLYMRNQQFGRDRVITYAYATSDDEGKYEFMDLIPAEYFVSASAKPWYATFPGVLEENGVKRRDDTVAPELNVAYPTTFYNGATESAAASPIAIEKGARVTADIHLNAVPAVHVTVKPLISPVSGAYSWPMLQKVEFDQTEQTDGEMHPSQDQTEMEVDGLPPGRYLFAAPDETGRPHGGTVVDVEKDGQTFESKGSALSSTVIVKLKTARGEDVPSGITLSMRNEQMRPVAFAAVSAKGEATFENLGAGKYAVMVNTQKPPQYTIGRISVQGGAEVDGHDVTVEDGATVEVAATLMAGVVSVEGVVKKNGKPAPGVMVALVPNDPRTHIERFRRDQSDLDGSFMVGGILPGKYTLIAVEDAWGTPWMKEGVLEKYLEHGQELTIGVLMNGTVTLPEALEAQTK